MNLLHPKITTPMLEADTKPLPPLLYHLKFDEDLIEEVRVEGNEYVATLMESSNSRHGSEMFEPCCSGGYFGMIGFGYSMHRREAENDGQPLATAALDDMIDEIRDWIVETENQKTKS